MESISAVTLATADMARAVAFYESLGFRALSGGADSTFTTFGVGEQYLNIQLDEAHAPVPEIWGRVIFYVADVDEVYGRALASGCQPSSEPADAPWDERYFHILDPDGHELSFARPIGARLAGSGADPYPAAPTDVNQMTVAFRHAILSGEADRMAGLYAADAVYFAPALGIAAKGRAAIHRSWTETFASWKAVDFEVVDQQLDLHDGVASSRLEARLTVECHETGERQVLPIRAASVFVRGGDGRWRYAVGQA
jgi:ketosteroid isomerase-like protein/catechol 2,3-dioxygenase-like lactoylglutathione lyase family enzyme